MSTIKEITSEDEWRAHVASLPSSTLLIISFHAPWAKPCADMRLVLDELAKGYPATDPPTTSWVSLNAEELIDVTESYDVSAVPHLVLQRGGKVLEAVSGSSASKVRAAIEKHASGDATATTAEQPAAAAPLVEAETDPADAKEAILKRCANLVKLKPVMVFIKGTSSKTQCGFSNQMIKILRDHSVEFGFFNILADDDVRQGLKEYADWPTYPQLWIDGELVGGLDILKEEIENDPNFLKPYSVSTEKQAAAE
ncbi:thioredoxin-like protein [Xylariomycetidae sp. FL0641]|nr:thioredoxin-like protein [Xylariomycetidae sp. FL0641]